jgi:hypothetical protein
MDFAKLFSDYGFNGIVIGTLFFMLWRMLVWVMKWVDKIEDKHSGERECWVRRLEALDKSIETHNQSSIESRKASEEAHRFQREEHKEMITILGRINGYK